MPTDRTGDPSSPPVPSPGAVDDQPTVARPSPNRTKSNDHPWSNSRFWILQMVVLAVYLIRLAATVAFHLDVDSLALEFSTMAVFLVPVMYAALNYGLVGAMVTSGWVSVLAIPRFLAAIRDHNYVAAWAELAQVILLDALAFLVGQRVTAERDARHLAESAQQAHLNAEALYRDLFDSNQAPILIIDGTGNVVETNASAQRVFPTSPRVPTGALESSAPAGTSARLVDMIGAEAAGEVLTRLISGQLHDSHDDELMTGSERVKPVALEIDGELVQFRPTATRLSRSEGGTRMQVVFEDVTAETRRHDLMEAYAARVVLGQEEERRHIAQELHDGPVQTLIHLCRQIDAIDHGRGGSTEASPIADLRVIVEETVAELRSIARGLRPSVLDDLGLVASINQMLSEAGERQQFETSFGVTGQERRLAPAIELALFRIAQEAITNVERHAAARRVAVGLNFEELGLRLLVRDDGIGFNPSTHPVGTSGQSLGVPGMTERAHLIGSRLIIHSGVGAGTTVDVWVPATILDQN